MGDEDKEKKFAVSVRLTAEEFKRLRSAAIDSGFRSESKFLTQTLRDAGLV